jgi:rhomboid protease GluP
MPTTSSAPPPERPAHPEGRLARLRRSPATSALLVALALAWVASWAKPELVVRFAKVNRQIRDGELWRLFTASFLHAGPIHLAVNGLALSVIGPTVEFLYGPVAFFVFFLLGGAVGFAASTLFVAQTSLGASAGLFALLGVLLGFAVRGRDRLPPAARKAMIREILTVAAFNLALGLMVGFIDNAAHVGGFVGGLALGLVVRPKKRGAA